MTSSNGRGPRLSVSMHVAQLARPPRIKPICLPLCVASALKGGRNKKKRRAIKRGGPLDSVQRHSIKTRRANEKRAEHRSSFGEPWQCENVCRRRGERDVTRCARIDTRAAVTRGTGAHRSNSRRPSLSLSVADRASLSLCLSRK